MNKPTILFFMLDQLAAKLLEAASERGVCPTPNIVSLDRQLGIIMAELKQSGRADNTTVILLADHGEILGDYGFAGRRRSTATPASASRWSSPDRGCNGDY